MLFRGAPQAQHALQALLLTLTLTLALTLALTLTPTLALALALALTLTLTLTLAPNQVQKRGFHTLNAGFMPLGTRPSPG